MLISVWFGAWTAPPVQAAAQVGHDLTVTVPATLSGEPGTLVPLAIRWTNHGPDTVAGSTVTVTPPQGSSIPAAQLTGGWTASGRSAVRTFPADQPPDVTRAARIAVLVPATTAGGSVLTGGLVTVEALSGTDSTPADNRAAFRITVPATTSPSPAPTPTPTPDPTPSPTTSPRASAAAPTTAANATPPTSAASGAATASAGSSTYVIAGPASAAVSPAATESLSVIEDAQPEPRVRLVPLAGAIACYTAAGALGVLARRRHTRRVRVSEDSLLY